MEQFLSSASGDVIQEHVLRTTAKNVRIILYPFVAQEIDRDMLKLLELYFDVLFKTALSTSISSSHRTACCNLICGSIEQCFAAHDDSIADFACSESILGSLQTVYFDCYNNAKEKSMKQVLSTTTLMLSRTLSAASPSAQVLQCLGTAFAILFQRHERNKAKPALHALKMYISRGVVDASTAIHVFQQWELQLDLPPSQMNGMLAACQRFLSSILEWVTVPDTAPSVGQLMLCLLHKSSTIMQVPSGEPIWAKPLLIAVSKNLSDIQVFRSYILPSLLQRGGEEFWKFLNYLRISFHLRLDKGNIDAQDPRLNTKIESSERILLVSSLQVGKELGFIEEIDHRVSSEVHVRQNIIEIPDVVLGRLLDSSDSNTRLSGLALLLTSKRSTKPYTFKTLNLLVTHLPNFYADSDPELRGEVQGLMQTLINRLRVVLAGLKRACSKEFGDSIGYFSLQQQTTLKKPSSQSNISTYTLHKSFLIWYKRFLIGELHPAASYQRHISSLKSINMLLRCGLDKNVPIQHLSRQAKLDIKWPLHVDIMDASMCRCLLDIQMDPFEDVRQLASEMLGLADWSILKTNDLEKQDSYKSIRLRARTVMARSGRADHADGLARFYVLRAHEALSFEQDDENHKKQSDIVKSSAFIAVLDEILSSIEESIKIAKKRLSDAVATCSVHGYFTSLRYIFELLFKRGIPLNSDDHYLSQLFYRTFQAISDIWDCVNPILCNDAPEGFLPDDTDEDLLSTKDVLSFAWRALKDSNLLLQCLSSPNGMRAVSNSQELKFTRLKFSGNLCFEQLADLRHRGAFSTVAQTFQSLCRHCSNDSNLEVQLLLSNWYEKTLDLIQKRGSVTTRRSAGIPALIIAILGAESRTITFESVMADLIAIVSKAPQSGDSPQSELPQVHALNCLRGIFSGPKLAEKSEVYIVEVMNIGSLCLSSPIWSIRNCGLMLFRGLIDRLLGTNESWDEASSARVFLGSNLSYNRYPGLIELLIRQLQNVKLSSKRIEDQTSSIANAETAQSAEATFPVLDLLRRAPPPDSYTTEIRTLLLQACASPHWHVRDLAARTYTASVRPHEGVERAKELLEAKLESQNHIHGICLTLKYMAQGLSSNPDTPVICDVIVEFYSLLVSRYKELISDRVSTSAKAAYLSAINSLLQSSLFEGENKPDLRKQLSQRGLLKAFLFRGYTVAEDSHLRREICLNDFFSFLATLSQVNCQPLDPESSTSPFEKLFKDRESCAFVLDVFIQIRPKLKPEIQMSMAELLSFALKEDQSQTVNEAAEKCLLAVLEECYSANTEIMKHSTAYLSSLDVANRFSRHVSPSAMDTTINIWGWSIAAKWQGQSLSLADNLIKEALKWIECIKLALEPSQEINLREAAIRSMRAFGPIFTKGAFKDAQLFISMAFAIYDALNDDDDELRALAADVAGAFPSGGSLPGKAEVFAPLVAASNIRKALVQYEKPSPDFVYQSLDRLLQQELENPSGLKSVKSLLDEIARNDNVLFVVEKQNIYIDEVREAVVWAQSLQQANLKGVSKGVMARFAQWVVDGLDTLIENAETQRDGALGWTSKPDVFILGIRVIRAAGLLIAWRSRTPAVAVKVSDLLKKLHALQALGESSGLHELWMSTLESVLRKSVQARVEILVKTLKVLPW